MILYFNGILKIFLDFYMVLFVPELNFNTCIWNANQ